MTTSATNTLRTIGPRNPSGDPEPHWLATLLGNIDGMVYRCRNDHEWTMEFVSDGCTRLTGYAPSDLLFNGRVSFQQIIHPDDRRRVREATEQAIAERRRFEIEYRIVRADGQSRWVWERGIGVFDRDGTVRAIEGLIQDITARKEAERRYRSLFDNAIEGIFRTTADGRYLEANPALAQIYGFDSPEELIATLRDIRRQLYVDPTRREEFMRLVKMHGSITGFESQVYRKNGEIIWISENARAVFDDAGEVLYYEGTVEDITERKLYQARIEQQANFDMLTGLANRSLLQERLERAIAVAASQGTRLAVAFVDLDRFKLVNDSLGHQVGDEFVLILNAQAGPEAVRGVIERVSAAIAQPWITEWGEIHVTSSIGVAIYPEDGADAPTLLRHADAAMYRAKDSGRSNAQFFTDELNAMMSERLELDSKLRRALERRQFVLHFQPCVELRTGRIVGAEALIRWNLPDHGPVEPQRFIPLAEETGLIVPIGRWVLHEACRQGKAWLDAGLPPMTISVNVSPRQFRQDNLVRTVVDALQSSGFDGRLLELELTENLVMLDAPQLLATMDELKQLGVRIAVDDFGTGYSSLSYLKRFPVDRLKIDRSFVQDVPGDPDDATIVRAIVALGHNLGLRVVAEGVETEEQRRFLLDCACDEVQGYFFGRPATAAELTQLLRP